MGLFDGVFGSSQQHFGPQEGFAGVLLAASACDGHIADDEVSSLITTLVRMKMYQNLTGQKFNSMMDRMVGMIKRKGPEHLLEQCVPVVPPELHETVFACAVDIVLSDGIVEDDEREFMNNLMIKLGVDAKRAKLIVDVMVIKNKG